MTETTSPSKPGVVLGPDGKPCKVCNSFRTWSKAQSQKQQKSAFGSSTVAAAAASGLAASPPAAQNRDDCPPDVEIIGRATWTFLHTTAAYFPDKPTPMHKAHMLSLLKALPSLYPCSFCGEHLGTSLRANPPDVSSRKALSWWLCERHNEVNARLGKEVFDCKRTDERWKDGPSDGKCD